MEAILQAHEHPGREHAAAAPHVSRARTDRCCFIFAATFRASFTKAFNEVEAPGDLAATARRRASATARRENDVYQYQGARISFHRHRRADAFHAAPVAIPHQPQSLSRARRVSVHGRRDESRQHRPRLGEVAVDRQAARAGNGKPARIRSRGLRFHSARVSDNPIYAGDEHYLKTLRALPSHLRRAFLDGDWDVFAGQYFDRFDHVAPRDCAPKKSTGSRGGRAGFRSTGASSIPPRRTGTRALRAERSVREAAQHRLRILTCMSRRLRPGCATMLSFYRGRCMRRLRPTNNRRSGSRLVGSSRIANYVAQHSRRANSRATIVDALARADGEPRENRRDLSFARRFRAPHRRSLDRRADGRRLRRRRAAAARSRRQRPRRRLDADVSNARSGRVAAHRQLHRADSHAAESGARSRRASKTSRRWTATIPPTRRATD